MDFLPTRRWSENRKMSNFKSDGNSMGKSVRSKSLCCNKMLSLIFNYFQRWFDDWFSEAPVVPPQSGVPPPVTDGSSAPLKGGDAARCEVPVKKTKHVLFRHYNLPRL